MEICVSNSLESSVHLDLDFSDDFSLLDSTQVEEDDGEKPNFEELRIHEEVKQEKAPKLKILQEESNDAILGKEKTYPIVIYSTLTSEVGKLLNVFKENKWGI